MSVRLAAIGLCAVAPAVVGLFIFLPLVWSFGEAAGTMAGAWSELAGQPGEIARLTGLLARGVGIATMAATFSAALGGGIFAATHRLGARLRFIIVAAVAIPILLPGQIAAIAWIQACGMAGWIPAAARGAGAPAEFLPGILYSDFGCAVVMAARLYPIAMALIWIGWRATPGAPVEALIPQAAPGKLWFAFIRHWLGPWVAAGWLIVFMLTMLDYTTPLLMRRHVFPVEIMTAYDTYFAPARARALALPLVMVSLGAGGLLAALLRRRRWPAFGRGGDRPPRLPPLPLGGAVLAGSAVAAAGVAVLLPLGTLLGMATAGDEWRVVFLSAREQIGTSLWTGGVGVLCAVALAAGMATLEWRRARRHARIQFGVGGAMLTLFALPGSVFAIAQVAFWNRPGASAFFHAFFDSGLLLPLGLTAAALPLAWLVLRGRLRSVPPVLIESESFLPPRPFRWAGEIAVPLLLSPAFVAAGLAFVLAIHETQAALLLAAPGQATLSIRAMTLLHYAPDPYVAAFCLIELGVLAGGLALLGVVAWLAMAALRRWAPHHAGC